MKTSIHNPRGMGAIPLENATGFRVWAPNASSVSVVGEFNDWNAQTDPMEKGEDGIWSRVVQGALPGEQYQFELTNGDRTFRKNDAYAREIHPKSALSVIYDPAEYEWKSSDFTLANWNELVLYELHVGSFAEGPHGSPGGFDQVIGRLPYLKNLGVNAIEILPPMAFPGERSWGYNLTNPFAVEGSYGGSDGLKRLIDAAHQQGIGVIIDVVYNHFGPDNLDLWQYDGWNENNKGGIYFYNDHRSWTPWGDNRPDYGRGEVRQYIRDNALLWLEEFRADGLRFDSVLFIRNTRGESSPETDIPEAWSLLQWLNEEIDRHFPKCLTIAEDLMQNAWITKPVKDGGAGFDAQWDSAFVHPLRGTLVTQNDEDRSMEHIAHAIEFDYNKDFVQRIIYSDSHDEDANGKARIAQQIAPDDAGGYFPRKRSTLGAGIVLTTPGVPMLFEGQEFLEDGWFRDDKALDWSKLQTYKGINRLYCDLVLLRRNAYGNTRGLTGPHVHVFHLNNQDKVIAYHRWAEGGAKDDVVMVANFSNRTIECDYRIGLPRGGNWIIRFNSDWKGYSPDFSDVSNPEGQIVADQQPYDGCDYSGVVSLPPYGFLILSQDETLTEPHADEKHDPNPTP